MTSPANKHHSHPIQPCLGPPKGEPGFCFSRAGTETVVSGSSAQGCATAIDLLAEMPASAEFHSASRGGLWGWSKHAGGSIPLKQGMYLKYEY